MDMTNWSQQEVDSFVGECIRLNNTFGALARAVSRPPIISRPQSAPGMPLRPLPGEAPLPQPGQPPPGPQPTGWSVPRRLGDIARLATQGIKALDLQQYELAREALSVILLLAREALSAILSNATQAGGRR